MKQLRQEKPYSSMDSTLYDHYAAAIFSYVYRLVSCRQDAEDIMVEAFLAAFNHNNLAELTPEQQLAWLQRVARNKAIDRYRHTTRLPMLPLEHAMETIDGALPPDQQIEQRETYEQLYRSLGQLSPLQQHIVRLRYGNHLRFAEIATLLEKSEGTVRKLLFRTLRQLRSMYEQQ